MSSLTAERGHVPLQSGPVDGQVTEERRYPIATFSSRLDVQPNQYEATWDELVATLTRHQPVLGRSMTSGSGRRHAIAKVVARPSSRSACSVADIDDGTSGSRTCRAVDLWGGSLFVVSTWSHTLERPLTGCIATLWPQTSARLYDDVWHLLHQYVFASHIDPSTRDPWRMFYGPSCPQERLAQVATSVSSERAFDWRYLETAARAGHTQSNDWPRRSSAAERARVSRSGVSWASGYARFASMQPGTGPAQTPDAEQGTRSGWVGRGRLAQRAGSLRGALQRNCRRMG